MDWFSNCGYSSLHCGDSRRTNQAQMTKTQKYRIQREFRRKTFYPNPPRRCNYVHQIVRFNAYLIIE